MQFLLDGYDLVWRHGVAYIEFLGIRLMHDYSFYNWNIEELEIGC